MTDTDDKTTILRRVAMEEKCQYGLVPRPTVSEPARRATDCTHKCTHCPKREEHANAVKKEK